jgi:hypothetical protein
MFTKDWQEELDNTGLCHFLMLLVALSVVVMLSGAATAVR